MMRANNVTLMMNIQLTSKSCQKQGKTKSNYPKLKQTKKKPRAELGEGCNDERDRVKRVWVRCVTFGKKILKLKS
jgi:hypothetical protein